MLKSIVLCFFKYSCIGETEIIYCAVLLFRLMHRLMSMMCSLQLSPVMLHCSISSHSHRSECIVTQLFLLIVIDSLMARRCICNDVDRLKWSIRHNCDTSLVVMNSCLHTVTTDQPLLTFMYANRTLVVTQYKQ